MLPFIGLIFLGLQLLMAAPLEAAMRPVPKIRVGVPPAEIIEEIIRHNHRAEHDPAVSGEAGGPYLTWLADCEARVQPDLLIGRPQGKIHAVRNLGNQVFLDPGALDYGVLVLHTPVLLITGNSDSQALHSFLDDPNQAPPAMRSELNHLYPAVAGCAPSEKNKQETPEERLQRYTECNVDYQVDLALERYADRVADGRLVVVGGMIDVTDWYGRGTGRLLVININGEKEGRKIRQSSFAVRLDEPLGRAALGREPRKAQAPTP